MRRRDPEAKRAAVLQAASAAFGREGFEATSAAAIARDAGVSEGIVFHYFGSKHGVLEACAAAQADAFAARELPTHADGIDYERLVAAIFEWLAGDRMTRRLWAEGDDRIVGALRRGWQSGIVPAVAEALMREQAEGKATSPRLSFTAGSGNQIPAPDGSTDLIFMSMVIHHLPDIAATAAECARVLRPGGYVCIWNTVADEAGAVKVIINGFVAEACGLKISLEPVRKLSFVTSPLLFKKVYFEIKTTLS